MEINRGDPRGSPSNNPSSFPAGPARLRRSIFVTASYPWRIAVKAFGLDSAAIDLRARVPHRIV